MVKTKKIEVIIPFSHLQKSKKKKKSEQVFLAIIIIFKTGMEIYKTLTAVTALDNVVSCLKINSCF